MPPPTVTTVPQKAELRAAALARRAALPAETRARAAAAVAASLDALAIPPGRIVSGFFPVRDEIDVVPLLARIAGHGHTVALPAVVDRTTLAFRPWVPGAPLVAAGFGLREPPPDAGEVDPEVLIVPLAAFDRTGHRIGYGRGYYDRALARLDRLSQRCAIGVAFAVQEVARVPAAAHDRRLDAILTEDGLIDCR
jgi:5-formyltetrahydrofolate cyclo-ligase